MAWWGLTGHMMGLQQRGASEPSRNVWGCNKYFELAQNGSLRIYSPVDTERVAVNKQTVDEKGTAANRRSNFQYLHIFQKFKQTANRRKEKRHQPEWLVKAVLHPSEKKLHPFSSPPSPSIKVGHAASQCRKSGANQRQDDK